MKKAIFHLPGLFEFFRFYEEFLPVFYRNREYFYDWCEIGSIYGAPSDCIWGGGRIEISEEDSEAVKRLLKSYGISARLTFSNSLLKEEHLSDRRCNEIAAMFEDPEKKNGIIVHSDLLLHYLQQKYPAFHYISSTTKVLTAFSDFLKELEREDFRYVVPDFRLNTELGLLNQLDTEQKDKVEFLCNECCFFGCTDRKICYENVSRKNLGENCPDHICRAPEGNQGYLFSKAMQNPGFISREDIEKLYLPMGFSNYKLEGRGLGSAMLLEFILYYMTKPEYRILVREKIYLDAMLDLF